MTEWKPPDHRGIPPSIPFATAAPPGPAATPGGAQPYPCDVLFAGPGIWSHGGTESWHLSLIPRLAARGIVAGGYAVAYADAGPMLDRFPAAGVPVHVGIEASRRAASLARLVVAWGDIAATGMLPPGKPVLAVAHGDASNDWTRQSMRQFRPITARYAAVSRSSIEAVPEDCRADASAIPNGVDPGRIAPGDGTRDRDRARYGFDGPTLLLLSRLSAEKSPWAAVQAMAHLPGWTLAVAGDGAERGRLESLAGELGVSGRVRFLRAAGHVGDLLRAADCLIAPSESEGFGLSVAEAIWSGLPAVACPVGCLWGTGRGTQVPIGSRPEAWADAVLRAVADRAKAEDDRGWARREFDPEVWADRWADLIRKHLPPPPPPGVGTALSKALSFVGIAGDGGCSCRSDAAEMDRVGAKAVLADIESWTDRLASKPQASGIPRAVIRTAIRAACWYAGA